MGKHYIFIAYLETMRKLMIVMSVCLFGCCPCRNMAISSQDSIRVEVVEHVEYIADTVEVAIPYQQEAVVRDTISYLENDFAISNAAILPNGRLSHSLETRPQLKSINIEIPKVFRDSIVYHNIYREVKVRGDLTKFQQFQINGFWTMITLFAIAIFIRWVIGRY